MVHYQNRPLYRVPHSLRSVICRTLGKDCDLNRVSRKTLGIGKILGIEDHLPSVRPITLGKELDTRQTVRHVSLLTAVASGVTTRPSLPSVLL